jgi:hypothetical protein
LGGIVEVSIHRETDVVARTYIEAERCQIEPNALRDVECQVAALPFPDLVSLPHVRLFFWWWRVCVCVCMCVSVCVSQDRILLNATNLVEEFHWMHVTSVTSQVVRVFGNARADSSGAV